jgi:hypothetical protein
LVNFRHQLNNLRRLDATQQDFAPSPRPGSTRWPAHIMTFVLVFMTAMAAADDYQIEVIVFKRLNAEAAFDANAVDQNRTPAIWPSNLIAIAPALSEPRRPFIWSQAVMLAGDPYTQQRSDSSSASVDATKPVFLLASESKANLNRLRLQQLNLAENKDATDPSLERDRSRRVQRDALLQAAFYPAEPYAFTEINVNERQLEGPAGSIRRSSLYALLLHQSWQQPIDQTPTPILVQGGQQFGDRFELEGTLSLRRQRFLHVEADLWLTQFSPQQALPASTVPSTLKAQFPDLFEASERGRTFSADAKFHLSERRRLRSGELHYLDHPALGVLILVTTLDTRQSL